jgi:hypothetical protein
MYRVHFKFTTYHPLRYFSPSVFLPLSFGGGWGKALGRVRQREMRKFEMHPYVSYF